MTIPVHNIASTNNAYKSTKHAIMKKLLTLLLTITAISPMKSEKTTTYTTYCGPFDKIEVTDNVNVIYECRQDSSGYLTYTGAHRFADAFILNNHKGKLKIQVNTEDVNDPELPTIHVYSNFLTSIENSSVMKIEAKSIEPCPNLNIKQIGNGTISVDGVNCDRLKASLATGNGTIAITGTAQDAKYVMVGAGTIQADLLKAATVKCTIIGAGAIGCWPTESINVKGLGSTKVYYRGDPVVKKGPGLKLFRLEENTGSLSTYEDDATVPDTNPAQSGPEEEEATDDSEETEEEDEESDGTETEEAEEEEA